MRIARAGLGAVAAALVATLAVVACGATSTAGSAVTESPSSADTTSGRSSGTPTPKAPGDDQLSPANLSSELLTRLAEKNTFRVVSRTTTPGKADAVVTADLRIKGDHAGLIATGGGRKVVKLGSTLYLKDAELTGDRSRPWSELAPGGESSRSADRLARAAQVHALIGGAAHATTFQRADRITVNGAPAQEYVVTIDLARATAADALGDYLTTADLPSLPEAMTLRIAVDAHCLPVQLRFTQGRSQVLATFSRFGQKLTLTPPSPSRIATPPTT
ncbi:hypothetical protein [Kribbella sp. NPDC051770]|uniref:hypothetical protein n=1 Tax=Kribbella sp. NPDC051770 TaxID=3155413 RepID=UPI0034356A5E